MKSKTYTITEDQIKDIFYFIEIEENAEKIKEWFPEAFQVNILEHLSKEAINKGYVDGALYIHPGVGIIRKVSGNNFIYDEDYEQLRINGFCIWDKGVFVTEILETIKRSDAEKKLLKRIID